MDEKKMRADAAKMTEEQRKRKEAQMLQEAKNGGMVKMTKKATPYKCGGMVK